MVQSNAYIITLMSLFVCGCTSPTTRNYDQNSLLPKRTANADRLRVLTPLKVPDQIYIMAIIGDIECRLRVESDGHVSKAERTSGSNHLWNCLNRPIMKLRFAPKGSANSGPWEVIIGVSVKPYEGETTITSETVTLSASAYSDITSGGFEMGSPVGSLPVELKIYIADVKPINDSTK
jgi:hypothetical protein